jgi:hypothetical protein
LFAISDQLRAIAPSGIFAMLDICWTRRSESGLSH